MPEDIEWPQLPNGTSNVELELFKAKLEVIKAEHQARMDKVTEQKKAEIAHEIAKDAATHAAEIERVKAEASANLARETADYANEYATLQEVYRGYIEVTKGEIARSFQRADFVQKVAVGIGTAHTAILALTFSPADNALPISGLAPAIFLSLSFFLATAYVAYFSKPRDMQVVPSDLSLIHI